MPNFRQNSTVRNYLSRREQRRVLLMVMSLGLIVALMFQAAKPSSWTWLWAGAKQDAAQTAPQEKTSREQEVDTRLPSREDLGPGVVRIDAPQSLDEDADANDYFPGVEVEWLRAIRDNEFFFPDEGSPKRKAWFNLLDVLNRTDEAELRKASTGQITFAQLFHQASTYRGKLVTVKGYVHRALPRKVPKNNVGIEDAYELWVSVDRGSTAVHCLQLPEGFPTGADVRAEVEITGFFYKRVAYQHPPLNPNESDEGAKSKMSVAPLLLAKTVQWIPKKPTVTAEAPSTV
ncbi:MAG: hypothetical protein IIA67_09375, partial [Planctomycetes bacterium]|nr:hypothetical protein [Planctomycetota bacterium]